MEFTKVYFLFMLPFNREDWIRYDMSYLEKQGVTPCYLDLSNLFFNSHIEKPTTPELLPYLKTFKTRKELKQFMREEKEDSILALDLPLRAKTTWLYRMMTSVGIHYVGLNTRWFPRGLRNKDKKAQLKKVNAPYLFKKLKFELEYQTCRKFVRKADAVFVPNNKTKKLNKVTSGKTLTYYTHSSDFDQAMLTQGDVSNDYIVFIDVYYPHHPDLKLYGLTTSESSAHYHKSMNTLFRMLEQKTGKKVVICAHPRRPRDQKTEFDYPIVYNKTSEYIKKAALVVNHYSTAVNYVVIYNKPLLFITIDAFKENGSGKLIEIIASRLGSTIVNANHLSEAQFQENYKEYLTVNTQLYKDFLNENIVHSQSSRQRFGKDLIDCMEKISRRLFEVKSKKKLNSQIKKQKYA